MQKSMEKITRQAITDEVVLERVAEAAKNKVHIAKSKSGIVVKGIDDMAVRFSRCCNPVPGDEIIGFVTRGRGLSIHRTDCINMIHLSEAERATTDSGRVGDGSDSKNQEVSILPRSRCMPMTSRGF